MTRLVVHVEIPLNSATVHKDIDKLVDKVRVRRRPPFG